MLLTHETTIVLNKNDANIVGHMCYAAYKLWNVCNYERNNYKNLGLEKYPDWYDQKSKHKDDLWFKSLPSQTAQEICKLLDKSWKSFYRLKESGGIENPRTPRYKKDKMPITYMQNGIQHENGSYNVRLSLPKKLKEYMAHTYDIRAAYLYLKNPVFSNMDIIKQIKIYPPANDGTSRILVIYEVEDVLPEEDNGHYLSIDLGLHNLMTCYDNAGKTFIIGREYLSLSYFYNKEIGKLVYDLHRGAEVTNEEMDEKMAQVDAKQEKLAALRDKLAEMRSVTACPHCGKPCGKDDAYCSSCGAEL